MQSKLSKKIQEVDSLQSKHNELQDTNEVSSRKCEALEAQVRSLRRLEALTGAKEGEVKALCQELAAATSDAAAAKALVSLGSVVDKWSCAGVALL